MYLDELDREVLFDGITADELDAAVRLELMGWSNVARFAVDRLVDGWDTPTLPELAAETLDPAHTERSRVEPRWRRLLEEVGCAGAVEEARATMLFGSWVLRLWRDKSLDLQQTLDLMLRLREPSLFDSPSPRWRDWSTGCATTTSTPRTHPRPTRCPASRQPAARSWIH